MSRMVVDILWISAAVLGVVLSLMYYRAAQKLYARDKANPPSHHSALEPAEQQADDQPAKGTS